MNFYKKTTLQIGLVFIVCFMIAGIINAVWKDEPQVIEEKPIEVISEQPLIRPKQPEVVIVEESTEEETESEIDDLRLLGEFKVSAFCSCEKCCGKWSNNRPNGIVYGASGAELKPNHSIAVDTDIIPYGKSVFIDGIEYVAEDCGGAIKGNRIDIYMDSHEAAVEFGVKNMMVYERKY